jgi:hypothetical protein
MILDLHYADHYAVQAWNSITKRTYPDIANDW